MYFRYYVSWSGINRVDILATKVTVDNKLGEVHTLTVRYFLVKRMKILVGEPCLTRHQREPDGVCNKV